MRYFLMMLCMTVMISSVWASDIPDVDSPGARVYTIRCSACHALPHPKRLDWPRWRHLLGVMRQRMHERGVTEPTKDEWRLIAAYLRSHAR